MILRSQFTVVRVASCHNPTPFRLHARVVDCSNLPEFVMFYERGLMCLYGTDMDQILQNINRNVDYMVVVCEPDDRVDAAIARRENSVWVDPSSADDCMYFVTPHHFADRTLWKLNGGEDEGSPAWVKPKPKAKAASKKKKRSHNKDGTFKPDDPATPENEAFEDDKK